MVMSNAFKCILHNFKIYYGINDHLFRKVNLLTCLWHGMTWWSSPKSSLSITRSPHAIPPVASGVMAPVATPCRSWILVWLWVKISRYYNNLYIFIQFTSIHHASFISNLISYISTFGYFRCMDLTKKKHDIFFLVHSTIYINFQPSPHLEELWHHHGKLHDHWQLQQLHNTRLDNEASSRWSLKNFPRNWLRLRRMETVLGFFS